MAEVTKLLCREGGLYFHSPIRIWTAGKLNLQKGTRVEKWRKEKQRLGDSKRKYVLHLHADRTAIQFAVCLAVRFVLWE